MSSAIEYIFPPAPQASLPVLGSNAHYPVRRIFCVGRNYLDHVRELGNDEKEPPIFFIKPSDTLVQHGGVLPYPPGTSNLHFEVELVVALGSGGYRIAEADALSHVFGYAVGLDMTKRDVQRALSAKSAPWELGKTFEHAMPCGAITPVAQSGHFPNGRIHLTVNGEIKQDADLDTMIWNVPGIIATLSQHYRIGAGDIIYTGTPAGVGPVLPGDVMIGEVEGLAPIKTTVVEAEA